MSEKHIEETQHWRSLILSPTNTNGEITMSLETLLTALADGQFHSGDDLGELLGVSRTAVWKQLKKVEELGLPLESIKGKGYCIPGGLDLLSIDSIDEGLTSEARALISEIDLRGVVDSTNSVAMSRAVDGAKGFVCTAERQTAGKGRRGKSWESPYGRNLYLSMVWEFAGGAAALEGLSLAVGVAVVDALEKAGVTGAQLKWPNDILYQGQKLSGILLEMAGDAAGPCQVVVGIGVNVKMPATEARNIDQPWIDVKSILPSCPGRSVIAALLLNELMPLLSDFERKGFSAFRDRWQLLDAYAGREVAMLIGNEVEIGRAAGVDNTGAMKLETQTGLKIFNGGEVSLRVTG